VRGIRTASSAIGKLNIGAGIVVTVSSSDAVAKPATVPTLRRRLLLLAGSLGVCGAGCVRGGGEPPAWLAPPGVTILSWLVPENHG
jgi:hypothetical protein